VPRLPFSPAFVCAAFPTTPSSAGAAEGFAQCGSAKALCNLQRHERQVKAEIWAPHFPLILLH